MSRTVQCKKLNMSAPGLDSPPYPGELGQRIYEHISEQAWDLWINHQTMLINEYRLSTLEKKSRDFLREEMEKFLFSDSSAKPPGFIEKENATQD